MGDRWADYCAAYKALMATADRPDLAGAGDAWQELITIVTRSSDPPPYHIALIVRHIERFRAGRDRKEIGVFEHGCGAGHTLVWLAAMGYTDVFGVDVKGDFAARNRVLNKVLGGDEERMVRYDGRRIPHHDARFDFIYSEQVIEHIADEVFENFYAEEARVMRPGGMAVHHVPHRLVPYDSHTRTWFIHYLPHKPYHWIARALGSPVPHHLHLRWPWIHRRKMREVMGTCDDLTLERFQLVGDSLPYYDGSVRLRRMLSGLLNIPLLGHVSGKVLQHFVMLETISIKHKNA